MMCLSSKWRLREWYYIHQPGRRILLGESLMFKRIDHVEIVTDKPAETERFYTEILGFRLKARDEVKRPDGSGLDLTYLDLGGTTVELIHFNGVPVAPMP